MSLTKRTFFGGLFGIVIPIIIGILVHYFIKPSPPKQYSTLSEITDYAKTLPEFPKADDLSFDNPDFTSFFQSRNPSVFGVALQTLGLWKEPPFSPKYMAELMEELTLENHRRGSINGKHSFIHIRAVEPTKIVVFGDFHAAFHSFVRDLHRLKDLGIIKDDLALADPNTFMVFNGDAIDRSPYNIDQLIVICLLLKKNPHQVFYLAGKHERDGYWFDYSLDQELVIRGVYYSKQTTPFLEQVLDFFKSLPEAVYLSGKDDNKELLRIAYFGRDRLAFDELELSSSFLSEEERVTFNNFKRNPSNEKSFDVVACFKTEEWRNENRINHGLGLLNQDHGAITWTLLSAPIMVNRMYLGFYDDAFAILSVDRKVSDTTLVLNHQDTRTMDGFLEKAPLSVSSGQQEITQQKKTVLEIGSTMSLTRGLPLVGEQLVFGANLRINQFNKNPHDQGVLIRYFVNNDNNVAMMARQNIARNMHRRDIKFFLLPMRGESILGFMDLITNSDSAVFFPATGETIVRTAKLPNIVNFRSTYADEVRAMIQTLTQEGSIKRFALFYENDTFTGRESFQAALREFKKQGITEILELPYGRGSFDFTDHVDKLKRNPPDALGFFSLPDATKELIREAGVDTLSSITLFALSRNSEIHLKKYLQRIGLPMIFGSPLPDPKKSNLEIAKLYRKSVEEEKGLISVHSFEAYVATSLLVEAVQSLKKTQISPKNVMRVFEKMKDYDFHGLKLTFDPNTRSLANYVWVQSPDEYSEWKMFSIKELAK